MKKNIELIAFRLGLLGTSLILWDKKYKKYVCWEIIMIQNVVISFKVKAEKCIKQQHRSLMFPLRNAFNSQEIGK